MFHIADSCDSLPVGGSIVKGRDYEAGLQADHILTQAHAEAEVIRREARDEYDCQQKQGYAAGVQQAKSEAAEQMLRTIAEATKYFTAVEQRAVHVVQKALHKILGEIDEQDLVVRAVRQALCWARSQSRVTLRVAPAHAREVQEQIEEIRQNYPAIDVVDVQADDRLRARDCILVTEIGSVDAGLDVQLAALDKVLQQAIHDPSLESWRKPLVESPGNDFLDEAAGAETHLVN